MHLCTQSFDRKVMVYPSHSSFLVIDPDSSLTIQDVNIPYYPKVDDVVRVKLNTRTLLVLAKDVDHGNVFMSMSFGK